MNTDSLCHSCFSGIQIHLTASKGENQSPSSYHIDLKLDNFCKSILPCFTNMTPHRLRKLWSYLSLLQHKHFHTHEDATSTINILIQKRGLREDLLQSPVHSNSEILLGRHCEGFKWGGSSGKESSCQCRRHKRCGFNPWVRKIPWRKKWQPTEVFLPVESYGQMSLMGYSL